MFAKRVAAFLKLTRIEHSIMLVIAVVAAELIVGLGKLPSINFLILSIVTPVFISMGSFAINDYFDVEVDKVNKKFDRPIVAGIISKEEAMYVSIACFLVGAAAALFINVIVFVIAVIFVLLSFLYSYKMKEMLLVGNTYIALSMAIPFMFGNYVVSNVINSNILVITAIIVLAGLGREIHGLIRDYEGDRKIRKVKSLPFHAGIKNSAIIAMLLYIFAIILSIYLFFATKPFQMNFFYLFFILVVDIMLLYVGYSYINIKKSGMKKMFSITRNLSLAAMALALIIFMLSSVI